MAWRLAIFLGILLTVLAGASAYMTLRSMALWPALARYAAWIWGIFGLFTLLLILTPFLQRVPRLGLHVTPLIWAANILFSLVSTYLVCLVLADAGQALLRLGRWQLGPWSVWCALALTLLGCAWGFITAERRVGLHHVEIPIADLPEGLEDFRIIQISDLHLGPMVRRAQVDHLVQLSNGAAPDLIAITGDLVDAEADGVRPLVERMQALQARHGVCFVTGNHEYYSGAERWLEIIRGLGWRVLDNQHEIVQHRGASLAIAGMPDPTSRATPGGGPDLGKALAGLPPGMPRILLYHPPTGTQAAARAGVSLQLSGHTHGGQYFPWSLVVSALFDHPKGLGRTDSMWIYTSPGTGFWGPPNRLLVPPELTLITLRKR